MAMDFFERQARARRRTGLLLFWFSVAVAATVLALNMVVWLVTGFAATPPLSLSAWLQQPDWMWITGGTLAVIFGGSLLSYLSLRGGGEVIARSVHARRILPSTADPHERMLLNVVEEMAIASGTPMPSVWVMDDEPGINAFVAGFEPTHAVLVVTRGALNAFDREQLQGVVGHEFSHILNGDMRLNVQLYAILSGILLLGKLGEFLLRSAGRSRGSRDSAKGLAAVALIGLALLVVGYAGLFCGRIIKAAIAREREYLADASSVQFTRNPDGIGEALLTIRNASDGSLLHSSRAEDMSHMCIAQPVRMRLAGLLATHPPLDERILAVDPTLLARDRARQRKTTAGAAAARTVAAPPPASGFAGAVAATTELAPGARSGGIDIVSATVGQPTPASYDYALRLRDSLPETVRELLRQPDGARVVIYGLVIAGSAESLSAAALQCVRASEGETLATQLQQALPVLRRLDSRLCLPAHDLALPTLRALAPAVRDNFLATLEQLAQLDRQLSMREYLSLALMRKHLAPGNARRPVRHRSYRPVAESLNTVLSLLCHAAAGSAASRTDLHARLLLGFGVGALPLQPPDVLAADRLHQALSELADLSPLLKKPLLDACVDAVRHDGRVQVGELELVRAIGEALDCPVPPLVG